MQFKTLQQKQLNKTVDLFAEFDNIAKSKLDLKNLTNEEKLSFLREDIIEFDILKFINRKNYTLVYHQIPQINDDLVDYFDGLFADLFAEDRNEEAKGASMRLEDDKYYTGYFIRNSKPNVKNPSWMDIRSSIANHYLSKVGFKLNNK